MKLNYYYTFFYTYINIFFFKFIGKPLVDRNLKPTDRDNQVKRLSRAIRVHIEMGYLLCNSAHMWRMKYAI